MTNRFEAPKTTASEPRFTQGRRDRTTCPHCRHAFEARPARSFLGFQKFSCPDCLQHFKAPLSVRRRIFYWSLLAIAVAATLAADPHRRGQPSIFAILIALAVVIDLAMLVKRRR